MEIAPLTINDLECQSLRLEFVLSQGKKEPQAHMINYYRLQHNGTTSLTGLPRVWG